MKKLVLFLVIAMLMALMACQYPVEEEKDKPKEIDGKIELECGNASFLFNLDKDYVRITNHNSDSIHVTIKKDSFIQVDNVIVYGNGSVQTFNFHAEEGDRVHVSVTIDGDTYPYSENFTVD